MIEFLKEVDKVGIFFVVNRVARLSIIQTAEIADIHL